MKELTREERLYTMRGVELIKVADGLGVKLAVNKARTALKESKDKAIAKILAAEEAFKQELEKEAKKVAETESTLSVPMPVECTENGLSLIETTAEEVIDEAVKDMPVKVKKDRKPRGKKTFESLLVNVPLLEKVRVTPNGKRTAVHVYTESTENRRRLFGYDGAVVIVTREEYLHGVVEIKAEKKNYGYRVDPTAENMIGIQKNYLATL